MAGNHTLGTIRGTIEIDYDGAGIVKAVRDTDRAKNSFGTLDGASNKVLGAFSKFTKGAFTVAGAVDLVTNSIHVVAGALAIVGPLAAAGFAAAPGLIAGFAGALIIAKVAVAGVGDSLKAAGGDSKKFEESLKKLSPQAQKFARAFRAAYPALKQVGTAIQNAFFKGTAGQIGGVVKRIASLRPQAVGVASAMGKLAQEIVKTATSSANINKLRLVLSGVNAFLLRIKGSIAPVINGFLNLAAQAGQFGGTLGDKVSSALKTFGDFIGKIDLASLFETALPILQQLGGVFSNLAAIAKQIFGVFVTDGGEAAGVLFDLTDKLRSFLESAQGQAALDALGQALQAISGAAGQVFLALLQALAPAIITLAPAVTVLAAQLAGVLVPAINALAPVLQALAGFIADNINWLGPLAGAVVAAAAAYKVYSAGATAVAAVQAVLNSRMVLSTAAWVRNTAAIVAGKAAQAGAAAVMAGQAVAAWTVSTAAIVANRVAQVASNIASGVQAVAAWAANTAAVIANRVAVLAAQGAMLVVKAATIAWTAVQWALNAALFANPIGLVVLAIAALVAGIILAWKNSETFRTVVLAVWSAIKTAIAAVVNWITGTVWPSLQRAWDQLSNAVNALRGAIKAAWDGIKSAISTAINAVAAVLKAVWSGIVAAVKGYINVYKTIITVGFNAAKAVISAVLNAAKAVINTIWRGIVAFIRSQINVIKSVINGISAVVNVVRNAFNRAKTAAQTALSQLVGLVRGLPGKVTGALGNLGGLLYSKGKAIIQGFIDGIKAMAGRVASAAKGVVSSVTKFLPGSPAEEGPLSGRGYVKLRGQRFMTDFAKGLKNGAGEPVAALYGAVNPIARAIVPGAPKTRSAPSTTPPPVTGPSGDRVYRIAVGDKEFAELVVDAITGKPREVKKATDEGARRSAWAGNGR